MAYEQLKLENQLCFPVYAASRLITREYQPSLDKLGITCPQYLALMVLWEHNGLTVNQISKKLILNTNTITPLLKRMEMMGIVSRKRLDTDERKVTVELTQKGQKMREHAAKIPEQLVTSLISEKLNIEDLIDLKEKLQRVIELLSTKKI